MSDEIFDPVELSIYRLIDHESERYYVQAMGFLEKFLSGRPQTPRLKAHLELLQEVRQAKDVNHPEADLQNLKSKVLTLAKILFEKGRPQCNSGSSDWLLVQKLFTKDLLQEEIQIPKRTAFLYLLAGYEILVSERIDVNNAAQILTMYYGDLGANLFFIKEAFEGNDANAEQASLELDRFLSGDINAEQASSFLFYCAAGFARSGATIVFIAESKKKDGDNKTPDFEANFRGESVFVECTTVQQSGKSLEHAVDSALEAKAPKFDDSKFRPSCVAVDLMDTNLDSVPTLGGPEPTLKKTWWIRNLSDRRTRRAVRDSGLYPIVQSFHSHKNADLLLISQGHLLRRSARKKEISSLNYRLFLVRELTHLPTLQGEQWPAWEIPTVLPNTGPQS